MEINIYCGFGLNLVLRHSIRLQRQMSVLGSFIRTCIGNSKTVSPVASLHRGVDPPVSILHP